MLELCKEILTKVSFDRFLFSKELRKAIKWLKGDEEIKHLRTWCMEMFGNKYRNVIRMSFRPELPK